ncbi:hypothetical protein B9Z55_020216 [Caenorhabditis nigoni]|uniref:Uncharacterized protein n=1 Tax=Caenorhabditis nigoni TaxID=1611254 RepID=A0A2G5TLU2_9PELO|nr:hypothetical protein B9Z55_020216 [Caenorhabditis nigoni]
MLTMLAPMLRRAISTLVSLPRFNDTLISIDLIFFTLQIPQKGSSKIRCTCHSRKNIILVRKNWSRDADS